MQKKLSTDFLEELYQTHHRLDNLAPDPLLFARGPGAEPYADPGEGEVAGLIAASMAYGQVGKIVEALGRVFGVLGDQPRSAILSTEPTQWRERLAGFAYRFHKTDDLALYFWLLRQTLERRGTLQALFDAHDEGGELGVALSGFCAELLCGDPRPLLSGSVIPPRHPVRHLLASPAGGGAAKRMCLYLRWMCRRDELDPGNWLGQEDTARLDVPLDVHVTRVGEALKFTRRNCAEWRMANEITEALRGFAPGDPLRYDFSLFRYGMEGLK